jgi:hypothetical protein
MSLSFVVWRCGDGLGDLRHAQRLLQRLIVVPQRGSWQSVAIYHGRLDAGPPVDDRRPILGATIGQLLGQAFFIFR